MRIRVLRLGGTYFFHEHVVAPEPDLTRRLQAIVKRPHRWMFRGYEVDRDTATLLLGAGFAELDLAELDDGPAAGWVRHVIVGTAVALSGGLRARDQPSNSSYTGALGS